MNEPLARAEKLSRSFTLSRGVTFLTPARAVRAVSDVDLSVRRGEVVGLVGESGSGKSTVGRLMLGLSPATSGRVVFDGIDLGAADARALRTLRRRMQLVFQDPYSSLDPRRRIGDQLRDGLSVHRIVPAGQQLSRVASLLKRVGLGPEHAERYAHAFSGGQRQRIGIARALSTEPEFLVADEPVSALDVSVQAQVLELLAGLREKLGLAMLFISHDLPAVRHLCDRVVVLYLGRVMEEGPTAEIFARPRHPYTRALLSAAPSLDPKRRRTREILAGEPPSPLNPPSGCVFRTRCAHATAACATAPPPLRSIGALSKVACINLDSLPWNNPLGSGLDAI